MTDQEMLEELKKQHLTTYKKAVQGIITNNTKGLIEDILSLIKKPPLDSMDSIKTKLLSLAKKEKIILNTEKLNQMVNKFRKDLKSQLESLEQIRQNEFKIIVDKFEPKRTTEIIVIDEKKIEKVNKELKKQIKVQVTDNINILSDSLDSIYKEEISQDKKDSISKQFIKYMKSSYQQQLLDAISMKTMIKDRTLISGINEQGERYLFTKNNSHLFDYEK